METYIHELDDIDLQILRIVQNNSRLTTKELAQKIHLSVTPTYERQRRLERICGCARCQQDGAWFHGLLQRLHETNQQANCQQLPRDGGHVE